MAMREKHSLHCAQGSDGAYLVAPVQEGMKRIGAERDSTGVRDKHKKVIGAGHCRRNRNGSCAYG